MRGWRSLNVSSSVAINPAAVRAYDIRGTFGRELGLDDARNLGLAYAARARAHDRHRIAVGRDGRMSSPALEDALISGLMDGGMHVHRIGLGPTPQLYYACHTFAFDGGVMVTGSHNPPGENGFKLLLGGHPVFGAELQSLVRSECAPAHGGRLFTLRTAARYVERLAAAAEDIEPFRVVWDCGSGAVGAVIGELTALLSGTHVLLNAQVDGSFPIHHPDPADAANLRQLQRAVREHRADLGIAFDGDGDRIGMVDETGEIVWPDQLLLLLAQDVLARNKNAPIVADVKSSRVLFDGIRQAGGRPVMAPSGYVLVRQAMLREQAPLAGEMSGHIMFSDAWYGSDDALYVAIRTLAALSRRDESLGTFRRRLPKTACTPELRLACPDDRKRIVVEEVAARVASSGLSVDATDGIRVSTPEGWWLLRASGTEPRLTVRCEAADPEGLERVRLQLVRELEQSGVDTSLLGTR